MTPAGKILIIVFSSSPSISTLSLRSLNMLDFRFSCALFCLWILNHPMIGHGADTKCCFYVLKNNSVSYQLSEPPGPSCTTTWSVEEVVVVDENGDVDLEKVEHLGLMKLILRGITDEKLKQVTYRQDCQYAHKAECDEPCAAEDVPKSTEATPSTTSPSGDDMITAVIIIILFLLVFIIVLFIYCYKRNHSSPLMDISRVMWREVPRNEAGEV